MATFAGCTAPVGTGYFLTATTTGLADNDVTAPTFAVTSGSPGKLEVCWGPGIPCVASAPVPSGATPSTQPIVRVLDGNGNVVVDDNGTNITLASVGPGTGTLTCAGVLTRTVVSGVASFSGCSIDRFGSGYQLTAKSSNQLPATSTAAFSVVVGPPAKWLYLAQPPQSVPPDLPFPASVQVAIADAGGNVVAAGITATITLTLASNPSSEQ